jgi:MFS family permease
MYGTEIVEKVWPSQKKLIPAILNLEQTLACLVTSYLLLKLGRKQILQFGTLTGIFSLLLISIGFLLTSHSTLSDVFILIGLVIFMANFGLSLGPIVWLYVPEILEPNKIPFSTMANWASASVIVILFPIFKKAMNTPAYLFLFFAAYCSVGFLFNQKYVIETKGKT